MKINFYNGTMKLDTLDVDQNNVEIFKDDIIALIDDYFNINGYNNSPISLYTIDQIENDFDDDISNYIPINGGQFFTDPVYSIEE